MLNIDKYRDGIIEAVKDDDIRTLCSTKDIKMVVGMKIDCCKPCNTCRNELMRWLFSEYEPPLLKNGDGLKLGDWIMVRDNDNQGWCKSVFLFYLNGEFYCVDGCDYIPKDGYFVNWKQARLPEDGE